MDIKDQMANALLINMYSRAKEDGEIYLYNFNRKSSAHLAAVHIAFMLRDVMGLDIYINTSLFNYLWLKWKLKNIKGIKRTKRRNVNLDTEIEYVEKSYNASLFTKIYEEYYHSLDRG